MLKISFLFFVTDLEQTFKELDFLYNFIINVVYVVNLILNSDLTNASKSDILTSL